MEQCSCRWVSRSGCAVAFSMGERPWTSTRREPPTGKWLEPRWHAVYYSTLGCFVLPGAGWMVDSVLQEGVKA